jgi:hypothetical protein
VTRLPVIRGDCIDGPRPCPYSTCRYHLPPTRVQLNGQEPKFQPSGADSCALDVADRGPQQLRVIGELMGIVRERVRQIEARALRKLLSVAAKMGLGLDDIINRPSHPLAAGLERESRRSEKLNEYRRRWAEKQRLKASGA